MIRYSSQQEDSTFWKHPLEKTPPKNQDFQAIKNLKQAESQLDLMKRRLSALRIKDEKNTRKSQTAIKKIKYHQFIQNIQQKQREKKEIHKQDVRNRIQFQRSLNSAQRTERKCKIREVRQMFQESKHDRYLAQKKASKQIQNRIKFINQQEVNNRQELRSSVKAMEEKSRRNYQLYQMEKSRVIRSQRQNDKSKFSELQESRQLQMQELARMEIAMLQRQSRSREAVESSMGQLNSLITHRRGLKKRVTSTGHTSENPEDILQS